MARAHVGTSGWAYAEWKPVFYPPETKPSAYLGYYATRFRTNEVNYTFSRLPTEKTIAGWLAATPDDFLFALKASQRITHIDRLRHPEETLPLFFARARLLGARLGPILFQTPPWLKRDDGLLAGFVAALPDARCALEVRHASWYAAEVYEILRGRGVALVHAEGEKAPSPHDTIGTTAQFAYVRLRAREGYTAETLDAWRARLREQLSAGRDVYAYFRHDDDGSNALAAERLRDALA